MKRSHQISSFHPSFAFKINLFLFTMNCRQNKIIYFDQDAVNLGDFLMQYDGSTIRKHIITNRQENRQENP